ncbi:MAG: BACON domain-containing protein, partial [Gammaproteobacteria bacterium]
DVILTVTKSGSGEVAANEGDIIWNGDTGTGTYSYDTPVILSAIPAMGSAFDGWTGCDSSNGADCQVTMTAPKSVTATFTALDCAFSISPASLSVGKSGGKGSVYTTATSNSCPWTSASHVSWVTLRKTDFIGSARVDYSVARNRTGSARTGTLTIAGQTVTIIQSN